MKIKVKALSPVHIGSGEEISPLEYVTEEQFMRLNMESLFSDVDFQPFMEKFVSLAQTQRYIGNLLPIDLLRRHPLYTLPLRAETKAYFKTSQTAVKSFIKSAGRTFIPGSSLKGSILSAMIWYVLKDAYEKDIIIEESFRERKRVPARKFIEDMLIRDGKYQDLLDLAFILISGAPPKNIRGRRFLPWLNVSDSNLTPVEKTLEVSLVQVVGAKRGDQLPILYETIKAGEEFVLRVENKNKAFTVENILKVADQFYRKVLAKDGYGNIHSKFYLLRLGQGSTAFSTSLLILVEDLKLTGYKIRPPHTRKLITGSLPFGWVEVSES